MWEPNFNFRNAKCLKWASTLWCVCKFHLNWKCEISKCHQFQKRPYNTGNRKFWDNAEGGRINPAKNISFYHLHHFLVYMNVLLVNTRMIYQILFWCGAQGCCPCGVNTEWGRSFSLCICVFVFISMSPNHSASSPSLD